MAVREALYFLSTVLCLWVNPAFLLVNMGATVRSDQEGDNPNKPVDISRGYGFLTMYVVAPEKFVSMALLGLKDWSLGFVYGSIVFDLCGVAALGAGLGDGRLPLALGVGYSAQGRSIRLGVPTTKRIARGPSV